MPGTKVAQFTWRLALFLAFMAVSALALAHFRAVTPLQGFGLVMVTMTVALVVLPVSIVSWIRARDRDEGKSTPARPAALLTGAMVGTVLVATLGAGDAPRINDITTDLETPPAFRALAVQADNVGRDMTYPEAFAAVQRAAYPGVQARVLEGSPRVALARALEAARALDLHVVRVYEDGFEATASSQIFRFVDDVVVRVRPEGEHARVDIRSKSRVGQGDMGKNAERIEAFLSAL